MLATQGDKKKLKLPFTGPGAGLSEREAEFRYIDVNFDLTN